uniref:DUF4218 domain-containing protein n=1 Tax=Tanacetum cinerariifolium TaxID=118510 RepID=A0A6L2N341_TANCI|nr:hypothetical protein [Tanacetum cinerariifolium]
MEGEKKGDGWMWVGINRLRLAWIRYGSAFNAQTCRPGIIYSQKADLGLQKVHNFVKNKKTPLCGDFSAAAPQIHHLHSPPQLTTTSSYHHHHSTRAHASLIFGCGGSSSRVIQLNSSRVSYLTASPAEPTTQPSRAEQSTQHVTYDLSYIPSNNEHKEPTQRDIGETSNEPTQATHNKFEELYASANEDLYLSCDYVTRLDLWQSLPILSKGYKLSLSYYAIKKTFKTIRLGYESIHACEHDCCLFRGKENKDLDLCPVCNTSKWKDSNTPWKKVPKKVLRYFLIILRLQCLYKSTHTVKEMIWHATGKCTEPGKMQHPVDGRAWKKFDTMYPNFAKELRNVQLGLDANGFNSFGNLSQAYSMWSVILTTYNLPPWLCMKESSFMLTLLIPGPKSSGKDIDVYLRPLIEDLKQYLPNKIAKLIIELCSLFKQICSVTLMEDDVLKAQIKMVDIMCDLELIYPPALFDIMIHLVIHLPLEAFEGGPIHPRWMFPFKRYMKKLKCYVRNKPKPKDNDKDPEVSITSELFALACGPTWTPISVNFCVVDGVRYVVHNRDERCTTQNSGICLPGPDGEIYYGQLQEILEFKYLLFKVVLFRVKWFDTRNQGRRVKPLVLRNNMTQIDCRDIIDVPNEDDDIIDDEDALLHDLADSNDEDLINVDDDGVDKMLHGPMEVMVAVRIVPPHHVPTSCGGCFANRGKGKRKPNLGGRAAGRLHTRDKARNLSLKEITNKKGPILILFETQFDLRSHMESPDWTEIDASIQQYLQKAYNTNKAAFKAQHWVIDPEIGTYNVEKIRRARPEGITEKE